MLPLIYKTRRWVTEIDWLAITRILVIQVVVLFLLSLTAIHYISWSSDQAQAEFARTIGQVAPGAMSQYRPSSQLWDHHGKSI